MELTNAGEIVEHAVRRQHVNISELSRRMNVNRRTLYNWFRQKRLPLDVVVSIGEVIKYDFSKEFKEEFNSLNLRPLVSHDANPAVAHRAELSDSKYYWMEKYISLLEDYKSLLLATQYQGQLMAKKSVDTDA